jgi:DNA-binding MarR family transcriptional regulator
MTGIIVNLAASGLVTREPDPEHGRIIRTLLTRGGTDLLARARRLVDGVEADMVRDIDPVERDALADLLAQCAQSLAERNPPAES